MDYSSKLVANICKRPPIVLLKDDSYGIDPTRVSGECTTRKMTPEEIEKYAKIGPYKPRVY